MTNSKEIRTIVGIIGCVATILGHMLLMPTYIYIYKRKSAEGFDADVKRVIGCTLWFLYGLYHEDIFNVITIVSAIGFLIEATYLAVFLIYCDNEDDKSLRRKNILVYLLFEFTAVALLICYLLTVCLPDEDRRRKLIGLFSYLFSIYTYASTAISVIPRVVETGSVEYMPRLCFLFVYFIANGIWVLYSLIYKIDEYLLISSGFGTLVQACNLVLYAFYFNSSYKAKDGNLRVSNF